MVDKRERERDERVRDRERETTPVDIIDLCSRQASNPPLPHKPSSNPLSLTTRFIRCGGGFYTSAPNTALPPERGKPSFHQIKYRKISVLYEHHSIFRTLTRLRSVTQTRVINTHTHTHTHTYVCVCVCVCVSVRTDLRYWIRFLVMYSTKTNVV